MQTNAQVARVLDEIAQMRELTGANPFSVNAFVRAARAISELATPVASMDREELLAVEGLGAKTVDAVLELLETGAAPEHAALRERVPAGLLDVIGVPGLGPKSVKLMWERLGVESVADLKRAIEEGSLAELPRMGAKSVERIRAALAFAEKSGKRTRLGLALPLAERVVEALRAVKGVRCVEFAGSLRRGRETIGDIDIVASARDAGAVSEAFLAMEGVRETLAAGATKSSVRFAYATPGGKERAIQMDLRVVDDAVFGAALLYFTGSKDHNVRLRERAQRMGMTLNEYGLFQDDGKGPAAQERGAKPVAAKTEEAIYEALGMPFIPPELREDRGEMDLEKAPSLVRVRDVKAELHAHTTASDGVLSIEELAEAARARGLHTIAVTDHSKSQPIAGGLSEERLLAHADAVREADAKIKGVTILAGSEVDILADGSLDYDDETLAHLDIVVASPHSALSQGAEEATARLLRAIEHPLVDILGHPTGRLIDRREGMAPDIAELARAAKAHDTALEVNAHWMRLDLRDVHVRAAVETGALVAIDCDAHGEGDFGNLRFGVATARRGWLPKARCVNTWSAKKLREWLGRKRGG